MCILQIIACGYKVMNKTDMKIKEDAIATSENRIDQLFARKKNNILSVYFTAGFPSLDDTVPVMQHLQRAGADLIEVGIPYSDPVADGPTIQGSNQRALKNGMSLQLLLQQLQNLRDTIHIPIILMGYLNPILQYEVANFCRECKEIGIDGVILPDLPLDEYLNEYKELFESSHLHNIFLITPQTSDERIRMIDRESKGFLYMVSSAGITGSGSDINEEQLLYFERVQQMQLRNPALIGFGISNAKHFKIACLYTSGAIIGSAFIKALEKSNDLPGDIERFIKSIKNT